ncbi:MAG TPA: serine protease, partial [Humisphaera sp.]
MTRIARLAASAAAAFVVACMTLPLSVGPAGPSAASAAEKDAPAALAPDVVRRGKAAAGLLDFGTGTHGTAFCVDSSGVFVSAASSARLAKDGTAKLVLNPGEKDERSITARLLRADPDADLSIFRADGPGPFEPLRFADDVAVIETTAVTVFGYPIGRPAGLAKDELPAVVVTSGRVTSLRRSKGELSTIVVDALSPTGGCPVLLADGRVVGMTRQSVRAVGVGGTQVVPVSRVARALERPVITFAPGPVPAADARRPREFTIRVDVVGPGAPEPTVDLTFGDGGGPAGGSRTVRAKA